MRNKISAKLFRPPITAEQEKELKEIFMAHFFYLSACEHASLSAFYDTCSELYQNAAPRKAKSGVVPEIYFGHIWRTMLIPISIFNIQSPLWAIQIRGAHDLWEEVYTEEEAFRETEKILGKDLTLLVQKLSIPGKFRNTVTTQAMREEYYRAISTCDNFDVVLTFIVDHLDCFFDFEGLNGESRQRKINEVYTYCVPLIRKVIAPYDKDKAMLMEMMFIELVYDTTILAPHH